MKILAVIFNIILIGFSCLVLITDGFPADPVYVIFTLWSLLTLILSSVVIYYIGASDGRLRLHMNSKAAGEQNQTYGLSSAKTTMRIVAIIFNLVFIGFVCWALVDQYPHPKEDGFIAYAVLMAVTPIINLIILFLSRMKH